MDNFKISIRKKKNIYYIIGGLCKIVDALVRLISLGYCVSNLEYTFVFSSMSKYQRKEK